VPTEKGLPSNPLLHIASSVGIHCKKPTHIQAHLVFADTQTLTKNQKSLNFCKRTKRKIWKL